jgi:hypothetical protein
MRKYEITGHHVLFITSLFPCFLSSPSRNGGALPAAMGAAAKRAYRLQERRSFVAIQLFAGGGGCVPFPNLPIPRLPGPPCFTVKSAGTAKSDAAGSVR